MALVVLINSKGSQPLVYRELRVGKEKHKSKHNKYCVYHLRVRIWDAIENVMCFFLSQDMCKVWTGLCLGIVVPSTELLDCFTFRGHGLSLVSAECFFL